jgi:hypothetical protein
MIGELRRHLFETLDSLKDKEKPLDVDRAKAVCEVAGKIIETAKVEVSYLQTVGGRGSGFIPQGLLPASKPADDAIPTQRLPQK